MQEEEGRSRRRGAAGRAHIRTMSEEHQPVTGPRTVLQAQIFARSMPWKQTCTMVDRLAPVGAERGLHLSVPQDPAGLVEGFDRWLRSRGGAWERVEVPEAALAPLRSSLGGTRPEPCRIPHPDETFDLLVLVGVLEHIPDDRALVAECHRVLKPGGRLVLAVRQARTWSLLRPLRRLFGVADQVRGRARPGYGESALFDVLKDGFDVEEAHPYSRFFAQAFDIPLQRAIRFPGIRHEMNSERAGDEERVLMAYRRAARSASFWYPAAWLASRLDYLLLGSRGHALAACGRRRQWRPRRAPTLKDGRSIAEATINTKIGTAAPF